MTFDKSNYLTNRTQGSARQKIEDLGSGIKLEMVYIPGESFLMGSPENEEGRTKDESPQHKVFLQPFYMSKYPITQEQYQVIMITYSTPKIILFCLVGTLCSGPYCRETPQ